MQPSQHLRSTATQLERERLWLESYEHFSKVLFNTSLHLKYGNLNSPTEQVFWFSKHSNFYPCLEKEWVLWKSGTTAQQKVLCTT